MKCFGFIILTRSVSYDVLKKSTSNEPHSRSKSITHFKILLAASVVFAFFLCWAPFHAQRLGYIYFKESKVFRTLNEYLYHISGFFYYFSATVNPILYNLMSLKYRQAFKKTLCSKRRRSETSMNGNRRLDNVLTPKRRDIELQIFKNSGSNQCQPAGACIFLLRFRNLLNLLLLYRGICFFQFWVIIRKEKLEMNKIWKLMASKTGNIP